MNNEMTTTTFGTPGMLRVREDILSAGRQLWLAGLGAVLEIEQGSRKVLRRVEAEGAKTFDRLVERGRPLGERQKQAVEDFGERAGETVRDAAGRAGEKVRDAGKLLGDTAEFEVKGLLRKIGLMTYDDVQALAARLEALSQKIDQLAAVEARPRPAAVPALGTAAAVSTMQSGGNGETFES